LINENCRIANIYLAPALQGKASITGKGGIATNKISQGSSSGSAESLGDGSKSWLEQYRSNVVAIGTVN
jgi:hypothetical protein